MLGYINKKKALEIIREEIKYCNDMHAYYIDRMSAATDESEKAMYVELANSYYYRHEQARRIYEKLEML